jgi:hypothetical protein
VKYYLRLKYKDLKYSSLEKSPEEIKTRAALVFQRNPSLPGNIILQLTSVGGLFHHMLMLEANFVSQYLCASFVRDLFDVTFPDAIIVL